MSAIVTANRRSHGPRRHAAAHPPPRPEGSPLARPRGRRPGSRRSGRSHQPRQGHGPGVPALDPASLIGAALACWWRQRSWRPCSRFVRLRREDAMTLLRNLIGRRSPSAGARCDHRCGRQSRRPQPLPAGSRLKAHGSRKKPGDLPFGCGSRAGSLRPAPTQVNGGVTTPRNSLPGRLVYPVDITALRRKERCGAVPAWRVLAAGTSRGVAVWRGAVGCRSSTGARAGPRPGRLSRGVLHDPRAPGDEGASDVVSQAAGQRR